MGLMPGFFLLNENSIFSLAGDFNNFLLFCIAQVKGSNPNYHF